jgi:hypothetical protein
VAPIEIGLTWEEQDWYPMGSLDCWKLGEGNTTNATPIPDDHGADRTVRSVTGRSLSNFLMGHSGTGMGILPR